MGDFQDLVCKLAGLREIVVRSSDGRTERTDRCVRPAAWLSVHPDDRLMFAQKVSGSSASQWNCYPISLSCPTHARNRPGRRTAHGPGRPAVKFENYYVRGRRRVARRSPIPAQDSRLGRSASPNPIPPWVGIHPWMPCLYSPSVFSWSGSPGNPGAHRKSRLPQGRTRRVRIREVVSPPLKGGEHQDAVRRFL